MHVVATPCPTIVSHCAALLPVIALQHAASALHPDALPVLVPVPVPVLPHAPIASSEASSVLHVAATLDATIEAQTACPAPAYPQQAARLVHAGTSVGGLAAVVPQAHAIATPRIAAIDALARGDATAARVSRRIMRALLWVSARRHRIGALPAEQCAGHCETTHRSPRARVDDRATKP